LIKSDADLIVSGLLLDLKTEASRGFDEQRWAERRFSLVVTGNLAKFGQHPELRNFLPGTGSRILVEASPLDRIWGSGLAADDEHAASPGDWPGLNLLGFALMEVRRQLQLTTEVVDLYLRRIDFAADGYAQLIRLPQYPLASASSG